MKLKKTNHPHQKGFTLIEVILTLVIAAIMGTMLVSLMGTNLVKSALPVSMVGDQYKIVQEMEKITSAYREQIKNGTLNITDFITTYESTLGSAIPYKDTTATGLITLTGTKTGATDITTQVLRITLRSGDQTLQAYFTQ
jgi:prepilin-type N-terminal cleavage/methylation domain-containing protein